MGLDQYLYAKRYTTQTNIKGWERKNEDFLKFKEVLGDDAKFLDESPSITIQIKVGYWRKANQIHQWFVDHCQNGEDDCREGYVPREQLERLRKLCKEIIADPAGAEEVLPVSQGFFFGSSEYDEGYFQDLTETIEIIDRCLELDEEWDFAYQSSW